MSEQNGPRSEAPSDGPYLDHGEPLPGSYAEDRIVALVRDPEQIFLYWDLSSEVRLAGRPTVIRVHCLSEQASYDIEPGLEADSWYLEVTANRTYRVEIHERQDSGELRLLASSGELTTPPRSPGESGSESPAEVVHASRHPVARTEAPASVVHVSAPVSGPPSPVTAPAPARIEGGFHYTRDQETTP